MERVRVDFIREDEKEMLSFNRNYYRKFTVIVYRWCETLVSLYNFYIYTRVLHGPFIREGTQMVI